MDNNLNTTPAPETAPAPAATPARAWGQAQLYRLPGCGHVARLRRPSPTALIARAGDLPNPVLSRALLSLLATNDETSTEAEQIAAYQRNARSYVEIAALAFVEPRLILDREPDYEVGEIAPEDLTDVDYVWIYYSLCQGGHERVATFLVR